MTFTHADQYPVMADDSRVSYHKPVYFPFDLRPDNRLSAWEMEEFDKEYAKIDLMGHRADPFTESQIDK